MQIKTMGAFIAALRKANGLTQRELADKLNVSDKAVSRWERDENAPDIMLIPVIAEIFGVTSDELLKGERITKATSEDSQRQNQKIEKQIKTLAVRAVTRFKSMCIISMSLSFIGVICLFAISYSCENPIIGFSVNALLAFVGAVITFLGLMHLQSTVQGNEIFENADKSVMNNIMLTKINFSFAALYIAVVSIFIGLPFIINGEYVIILSVYVLNCVPVILAAALLLCATYPLYRRVIFKYKEPIPYRSAVKLNITQFIASAVAIICHEILFQTIVEGLYQAESYGHGLFESYSSFGITSSGASVGSSFDYGITPIITIICGIFIIAALLVSIGVIPFFSIKAKENRRLIILSGCRNAALLLDIVFVLFVGKTAVSSEMLSGTQGIALWLFNISYNVNVIYNPDIILLGVFIAAVILIAYFVLKFCFMKNKKVKTV